MWDILKAIFGFESYRYIIRLKEDAELPNFIEIKAKNFLEAKTEAEDTYRRRVIYIQPIDEVVYTKGERGANTYEFLTVSTAKVIATSEANAKKMANKFIKPENVVVKNIIAPMWVDENYYKGI